MALPSPNLDDRRFQQLVDEAKRYVQQRAPEWTDHNVSDPGVTLIETFAYLVDQLLYRLNRVPDKNYTAFLDLLGIRLFPPAAAVAEVDFWLSAPQLDTVTLTPGTEVATAGGEAEEAVVFTTTDELCIVPSELIRLVTASRAGEQTDRTGELTEGRDIPAFQAAPQPGDALLFGLPTAVPRCVVAVNLDSRVEGIGVDPRQPPLVWEAWDGGGWQVCETGEDSTGGLNRPGEVIVYVPAGHTASVIGGTRAGWLRCRVTEAEPGQPFYSESPTVREASVFTVGGTMTVEHAETETDVPLGTSEGVAGQRFRLGRPPVLLDREPPVVEASSAEGWQRWDVVEHFGRSGPADRHVQVDATTGEFTFPPVLREPDGTLRQCGAVPPKGARIRVARYRTGGGPAGNVARGAISVLRSSVPYVARVVNRESAGGGVAGETLANARLRAPDALRMQERAVTARDYEIIAGQAAPSVRRVRCLPAAEGAGAVRVLVVPDAVADEGDDRLRFEQLIPSDQVLRTITASLDERRLIGTRLVVEPPVYQGVTVVARLAAAPADTDRVREAALAALFRHLNPLVGGPDGTGWPFGRPAQYGDVFGVLQRAAGNALIEEILLFPADPVTGRRGAPTDRVDVAAGALVFSYQHQVVVTALEPEGRG
ncbi:putative baseplate assembly protein [Streptomyces sp. NPDC056465]|uniref:putative baseplate assembly protein n=1 Tax=Streptomyces sp. NPDC056465 TaxID=3345829 RepID=UPI0036A37229